MGSSFDGAGWLAAVGCGAAAAAAGRCRGQLRGLDAGHGRRPPDRPPAGLAAGSALVACAVGPDGVEPDGSGPDGSGTVNSAGVGAKIRGISVIPEPPQIGQARWAAASISRRSCAARTSSSRASSGTCGSSAVSWSRLSAVKSRSSEIEAWSPVSA